MHVDPAVTVDRCGCMRGVILVTRCGAPAVDRCSSCHDAVCEEHAATWAGLVFCTKCMDGFKRPATQPGGDVVFVDANEPSWHSEPDPPAPKMGMPTPTQAAPASSTDDPFTAEDYEAFDAVGDADTNAGIDDGFDS